MWIVHHGMINVCMDPISFGNTYQPLFAFTLIFSELNRYVPFTTSSMGCGLLSLLAPETTKTITF